MSATFDQLPPYTPNPVAVDGFELGCLKDVARTAATYVRSRRKSPYATETHAHRLDNLAATVSMLAGLGADEAQAHDYDGPSALASAMFTVWENADWRALTTEMHHDDREAAAAAVLRVRDAVFGKDKPLAEEDELRWWIREAAGCPSCIPGECPSARLS